MKQLTVIKFRPTIVIESSVDKAKCTWVKLLLRNLPQVQTIGAQNETITRFKIFKI